MRVLSYVNQNAGGEGVRRILVIYRYLYEYRVVYPLSYPPGKFAYGTSQGSAYPLHATTGVNTPANAAFGGVTKDAATGSDIALVRACRQRQARRHRRTEPSASLCDEHRSGRSAADPA